MAVGLPLLMGVVTGDTSAGALACLGAYVAAFTNKGGPRRQRTTGLVVAAAVNALAFWTGEMVAGLFPVALTLLMTLVFLAAMGSMVHGMMARLGTMPVTALLTGAGEGTSGTDGQLRHVTDGNGDGVKVSIGSRPSPPRPERDAWHRWPAGRCRGGTGAGTGAGTGTGIHCAAAHRTGWPSVWESLLTAPGWERGVRPHLVGEHCGGSRARVVFEAEAGQSMTPPRVRV
ncbi:hypothetical protein AB0D08_38080 [Kitasatospora sp. NPDC048540]|uniref:hypothetical protein n=1 Tax=unclassified Kitasatospora TaxID=2633591 RepID=UPI00053A8E79|nr:hypothetical protein [Kitasatospora sp. MBT63]